MQTRAATCVTVGIPAIAIAVVGFGLALVRSAAPGALGRSVRR